jgi:hypothetical protein
MPGLDILVATGADFALLRDGRPVASGTWDDVVRARAFHRTGGGGLHLGFELRDGSTFVGHEDAPGWDDLLDAAESALPGMPPRARWLPALTGSTTDDAIVVYERDARNGEASPTRRVGGVGQ